MLLVGTRGRATNGNKGKGFRAGKREEVLEVWKMVNGGRALFSFKFTTVYLIELLSTLYLLCRCYFIITNCHGCTWCTIIFQVIILYFLFVFCNSRDIIKWIARCYWRNGCRYSDFNHHCGHLKEKER